MTNPRESLLGLLSLAPELIETISDNLDLQSVTQLRLTCKLLAELLCNAALRTVSIDVTGSNYERSLSKLAILSTSKHAASTGTRELYIGSLSISDLQGPLMTYDEGEGQPNIHPKDQPDITVIKREIQNYLYDAIASFKGAQNVIWTPTGRDSKQSELSVLNALKTLPNLRRLRINIYNLITPLDLESFDSLQEITLEEGPSFAQRPILEILAKLMAKNSGITSINISCFKHSQNLHQLFQYYSSNVPPLRLRHLGLKRCLMRLDEITLPHLRNLTSLDITSIKEPDSSDEVVLRPPSYQEKRRYGSSLEDVWKALHGSGVHLEAITLDIVTNSFIDYLYSYTGLRKLDLAPGGFNDDIASDAMAKRFFAEVFMIQAPTLEDLRISPKYEGLWCYGFHNMECISKCINLKTMKLSVMLHDLNHGLETDGQSPSNPDAVKLVVDTAVTFMPYIKDICLSGTTPICLGPWNISRILLHSQVVHDRFENSVLGYRAPLSPSCNWLPALTIETLETHTFVGSHTLPKETIGGLTESEDSESLRYINISPPISSIVD